MNNVIKVEFNQEPAVNQEYDMWENPTNYIQTRKMVNQKPLSYLEIKSINDKIQELSEIAAYETSLYIDSLGVQL